MGGGSGVGVDVLALVLVRPQLMLADPPPQQQRAHVIRITPTPAITLYAMSSMLLLHLARLVWVQVPICDLRRKMDQGIYAISR